VKGVARRVDIHNPPLTGTIPSGMRLCRSAREVADLDVHVGQLRHHLHTDGAGVTCCEDRNGCCAS
jgi:hypothetical protein